MKASTFLTIFLILSAAQILVIGAQILRATSSEEDESPVKVAGSKALISVDIFFDNRTNATLKQTITQEQGDEIVRALNEIIVSSSASSVSQENERAAEESDDNGGGDSGDGDTGDGNDGNDSGDDVNTIDEQPIDPFEGCDDPLCRITPKPNEPSNPPSEPIEPPPTDPDFPVDQITYCYPEAVECLKNESAT
jgi:hypothetical protein